MSDAKTVGSQVVEKPPSQSVTKKRGTSSTYARTPLLHVVWEDHFSNEDWQSDEDVLHEPMLANSVGWLIKETEKTIVIAQTVSTESSKPYASTMTILKHSIQKRIVLRSGKESSK